MSDKRIGVGDLVMVVRWPCCGVQLGKSGRVTEIFDQAGAYCVRCGTESALVKYAEIITGREQGSAPIAWLKRIDPLSEPESVEHKEEVPA